MIRFVLSNVLTDGSIAVDSFASRLCRKWTLYILLAFSFVVTCRLAFGDSISCISNDDYLPRQHLNTRCYWDAASFGTDKMADFQYGRNRDRTYASVPSDHDIYSRRPEYYPWVNLTFIAQAVAFVVPYLLWKVYEGGQIAKLTLGLQKNFGKEHKHSLELLCLAKYLILTQGRHRLFGLLFVGLEVGNFVLCFIQNFWLASFFQMDVTVDPYVLDNLQTWKDYRELYFPPSVTCLVKRYSSSGDRISVDVQCLLPLHPLFMNMYLILKGWYIFLALATGFTVLYRLSLLMPFVRKAVLRRMAPIADHSDVQSLCHHFNYTDWVFLDCVRNGTTEVEFSDLLEKVWAISQRGDVHKEDDSSSLDDRRQKQGSGSILTSPL